MAPVGRALPEFDERRLHCIRNPFIRNQAGVIGEPAIGLAGEALGETFSGTAEETLAEYATS